MGNDGHSQAVRTARNPDGTQLSSQEIGNYAIHGKKNMKYFTDARKQGVQPEAYIFKSVKQYHGGSAIVGKSDYHWRSSIEVRVVVYE